MEGIEDLIFAAWKRIKPRHEDEPALLAQRLARRRRPTLTRPPRAWCIAVRASDHRISSSPCHELLLTRSLLAKISSPVQVDAPGEPLEDVARKLGTSPAGLLNARLTGKFRTHYIPPTGGRGKPVPLLYTEQPLDPCARHFAQPDPVWLWTAHHLFTRLPQDFTQTLTRVPVFRSHVSRRLYDENRHPELDPVPPRGKSKALPKPPPDLVAWYKWSRSGYFLGTDPSNWRKSPQDLGERPPRDLPRRRAIRRTRPSTSKGSEHFNGFNWLCPICNKACRTLYYPVAPLNLLTRAQPRLAQIIEIPRKIDGFACARCHQVRFFSRLPGDAWNQLIAYLTAGLLYGREVPRPSWFTPDRKRPYKPQPNPRPALRRQQVLDSLLRGPTRATIAAELRMSIPALTQQINKIYKSERVRGQRALLLKYKKPLPPHLILKRDQVLAHLQAGRSPTQVAHTLHIQVASVERHIRDLRRFNQLPRRQTKRSEVADLHKLGLSRHQIAAALSMTPQSVSARLCELRRAGQLPPASATLSTRPMSQPRRSSGVPH